MSVTTILGGLAPHTVAYVLLGMAACVGSFALLIHAALYGYSGKKAYSQLYSPPSPPSSPSPTQSRTAKAPVDYSNVFPPSQRHVLQEIASTLPSTDVDLATKQIVPIDTDYRRANPSSYIFTGFSVGEIKALGDFPDYAKLSGVPLPAPLKDFDIDTTVPRPYRPFRWSYHQTMSLQKMDSDYWLELESTYRYRIRQRQELHAQYGKDVLQTLPGSELACKELLEMVVQFLCARYPRQFQLKGKTFVNQILDTTTDLGAAEPLHVLLDNVPEDFAITLRDEKTGKYYLRAGVICSSVGWNLNDKMGLGLPGIHAPVPDYKEKMEFSMDRFFTKMTTFSPIQRGSWGLEMGYPLYLPAGHPDLRHREAQSPDLKEEEVNLRVDWQTLRRLPLSGGVVFSFKALFTPLTAFRDEPYIPSLVLKVLSEGKESMMKYKGTYHVEHVAKPALKKYAQYQVEQGMTEEGWEPHTLEQNPFFPGWEEKLAV